MSQIETVEYLEKLLAALRAKYLSGDKSVEAKLRAVATKLDRLKISTQPAKSTLDQIHDKLVTIVRKRKGCCRS